MDDNITYDQLPVMSPMMASNSNESGNGGQSMMDDGETMFFRKIIIEKTFLDFKFLQNGISVVNPWMPPLAQ